MDIVDELRNAAKAADPSGVLDRAATEIAMLRDIAVRFCPEVPDPIAVGDTARGEALWGVVESLKRRWKVATF
jgi:hypothetical protein